MLSFHFRKKLRDFQLAIGLNLDNETLVLIGHSGCGKTTTLQLLAGLQVPDEGFVELHGRKITDTEKHIFLPTEHRRIGYVFQDYALFPHLTVRENILYGIRHFENAEQETRLHEVLSLLQLRLLEDILPASLSGGQQQRVALARALVTRPELLLLDEPLSALDVSTRGHVRRELKSLLDSLAIPCIVVTHDLEDARVLGDKMAVIDKGQMIQMATPAVMAQQPASPFVAEFIGTNLVTSAGASQDGSLQTTLVAFDPWQARISREPTKARYQWDGTVRDIVHLGAFTRVHVDGPIRLMVDVPVQEQALEVGDHVYVHVADDEARVYSSPAALAEQPLDTATDEDIAHRQQSMVGKRRKNRWRMAGMMTSMAAFVGFLLVLSGVKGYASSVTSGGQQTTMEALVAANATDPMAGIIQAYEALHPGINIKASYAGTQVLQTQLEQGAPADLFLSANLSHIQALAKEGLVQKYYKVSNDHEVIIVPKNNPGHITSLKDLGTQNVKLIIGVNDVPIGQYTRQIFQKAAASYGTGFDATVMSHVVSTETNVKQILETVAMGEADAGIVYMTDVTPNFKSQVKIINIPSQYNVVSTNYIAVPTHSPHPQQAEALLQFMLSAPGQAVFKRYHYDPIK